MNKNKKKKIYKTAWDAIADSPQEAAHLKTKSELMQKVVKIIESKKWTQVEAAKHCCVTQPRLNDLLHGRISKFSLDALVKIAVLLGQKVHIELEDAA